MNQQQLRQIVDRVAEAETNDFEETTREERYWMQIARDLANEMLEVRF